MKVLRNADKSKDRRDPISKTTQSKNLKEVLKRLGLDKRHGKLTHMGRKNGAKMAEFAGVNTESIRLGGRWNNQALENCYLQTIPRDLLRGLAGFDPKRKNFYIPRAMVTPPPQLKKMVFPGLSEWTRKWNTQEIADPTVSLDLFLKLMDYLSEVFIQDSCLLMDKFNYLFIYEHPLFRCAEFQTFKQELIRSIGSAVTPADLKIQEVFPDLLSRIDEHHQVVQNSIAASHSKVDALRGIFH